MRSFFFQAEDGIRDLVRSRGLGDVYKRQGYYEAERAEKLKTIALVEAVRAAVGPDVELLIEMHGRFNPVTAVEMARELAPFKPSWYEEPVPPANLPALKKVADAVAPLGIPVATGERIHTPVSYTHLRAHETVLDLVCRLLLEKKKHH